MQMDLQDSLVVINEGKKTPTLNDLTLARSFRALQALVEEPDLTSGLDGDHEGSGVGNIFSDIIGFALRLTLAFSL